ncbi:ATP-binding cassette domain-containing protein [Gordonia sp. NPDC058843]|uniref:ABC transporter ATP-binding protein/permease n=1 Tax=Gordonia sp. NPDC058843 TaxID=3346648 RepID=UPI0036942F10
MTDRSRRLVGPAVVLAVLVIVIVLGPFVAPFSPTATASVPFELPSSTHWLGTDFVGRDVMSRILHGGYRLVLMTAVALSVSYLLGVLLGVTAGISRGLDGWVMRPVDAITVLPWFLLLVVIATTMGKGPVAVCLTVGVATIPWVAKVVRTATIELMDAGFVEAAISRGETLRWIAIAQVLPNLRPVLLADAGIRVSGTIALVTAGSFLGLGVTQPQPDWALMVTENKGGMALTPWPVVLPAACIAALVVSVNLLVDRMVEPAPGGPRKRSRRPARGAPDHSDATVGNPISVSGLTVAAPDGTTLVEIDALEVRRGETLALVGPSGAGKTTTALALVGALPPGLVVTGGVGVNASPGSGRRLGYVPQDPGTSLNPSMRIGSALREVRRAHRLPRDRSTEILLAELGLPTDREFLRRYPAQLSGGQQQRVLLAIALLGSPGVLVLDEPTSGLDATTADDLVGVLDRVRTGRTVVIITHDLQRISRVVDRVVILDRGRITGERPVSELPAPPDPTRTSAPRLVDAGPRVTVRDLSAAHGRDTALRDVSFDIGRGECVAVVGRSGAGKSTLARCLAGLHPPTGGEVVLDGTRLASTARRRRLDHRRSISMVYQNPRRSLDPRRTVGQELRRVLLVLRGLDGDAADREMASLLAAVHLGPEMLDRRPGELSGGQIQRVAIARALAGDPDVLICDEVTSSLDAASTDAVLTILEELRAAETSVLLISHDARTVRRMADRVLTMVDGRVSWTACDSDSSFRRAGVSI